MNETKALELAESQKGRCMSKAEVLDGMREVGMIGSGVLSRISGELSMYQLVTEGVYVGPGISGMPRRAVLDKENGKYQWRVHQLIG
jgi:hypothetical protein